MTAVDEAMKDRWGRAKVYLDIAEARVKAHQKHGSHSIERLDHDHVDWLPILVEEIGEVARALTYDGTANLRAELIDVAAVAAAWIDRIDSHT